MKYAWRRADGEYCWFLVRRVPLRDETGNILKWYGVFTDIDDRKRAEALIAGEKRVLELVAKGDPLPEILDSLCRLVEEQAKGALASILLVEGDRLKHGGAPSLPRAYTDAIDGVLIGPSVGSCGTAAYAENKSSSTILLATRCGELSRCGFAPFPARLLVHAGLLFAR